MSGFSNFAVSFTIISVLSGCLTLYFFGMTYGGPVVIVWGWLIVGAMTLVVGLGMAEIASAYPTAGGLYFWAAKLSENNSGAWSWFTGWFNLLGQVAVTAGIDYGFAFFFTTFLHMTTNFPNTLGWVLTVYACVLVVHGLLNTFGVSVVALLSDVSAWWHIGGVLIIAAVLAFVPSHHASASFVFTTFKNQSTLGVPWFVFMIGLLMAQYTFTGYDASAHMSEETHNADISAPTRHRQLHRHFAHRRVDPAPGHHLRHPDEPEGLRLHRAPNCPHPCSSGRWLSHGWVRSSCC